MKTIKIFAAILLLSSCRTTLTSHVERINGRDSTVINYGLDENTAVPIIVERYTSDWEIMKEENRFILEHYYFIRCAGDTIYTKNGVTYNVVSHLIEPNKNVYRRSAFDTLKVYFRIIYKK